MLGPALVQALLGTLTVWIAAVALRRRLARDGLPAEEADRAGDPRRVGLRAVAGRDRVGAPRDVGGDRDTCC